MSICWAVEQPEEDFSQSHVHVIQGWSKVVIPQSTDYPKISNPCMIQNNNLFYKHVQGNLFLHLLD